MYQKKYRVTLTGATDLLMHADDVEWADQLERWLKQPENKKNSKAGDDRTPAWKWIGCLYHEAGRIVLPSDNLMTMLREGGARVPTGKGQKTFKAQSQSGLLVNDLGWPLQVNGSLILMELLQGLLAEPDFAKHQAAAAELGFELFVKRAKIGNAKHVRVRPRFPAGWVASGTVTVLDSQITTEVLRQILVTAGTYCGIGDWRPSSPSAPGAFGKFSVELEEL